MRGASYIEFIVETLTEIIEDDEYTSEASRALAHIESVLLTQIIEDDECASEAS